MKKNKILIVGGGGFIGKWLINSFYKRDWETSIIDPHIEKKHLDDYLTNNIHKFSINNSKLLAKCINSEKWDYIIFLAAWGGKGNGLLKAANENFNSSIEVNVKGFANLLDKAKRLKNTKILWSSSTVVYGEEKEYYNSKVKESSSLFPITYYGLTKTLAEKVAEYFIKEHKMHISGLRLPIVIGPGLEYRGVAAGISDMAKAIKYKKSVTIDMPSTPLDLIYIKDVSNIFTEMILTDNTLKPIYNVPSYRIYSNEIADMFNKLTNISYIKINKNSSGATYPIMISSSLKKDINYSIKYDLRKSVLDWLRELE